MTVDIWAIIGTILAAAGLVVAVIQTLRYRVARQLLLKINQREQISTWALYDLVVQAYDSLNHTRSVLREPSGDTRAALESAAKASSLLNAMWLRCVEQAALLEPTFDEAAIERWKEMGRLDSEWRYTRARKLLPRAVMEVPDTTEAPSSVEH